jgi:hypothetical protein
MNGLLMIQAHHNVHEWLIGVLGLAELVAPTASVIIHLIEDTGNVDWEVSRAVTTVGSSSTVRDMRFVVGRVNVLPVPAALEVLGNSR